MAEEINKYKEAELIIGSFAFLFIDGVCFLIDWTGIGLAISPVIQGFGTAAQTFWAWKKGDKTALKFSRQAIKYALNILPLLPTLTIVFLVQAFVHNNPKIAEAGGKLAGSAAGGGLAGPLGAKIGSVIGQYAGGSSLPQSLIKGATSVGEASRNLNIPKPK
ncbi:MAG: hypothetical protein AAB432_01105 [Patescibacteria group bacterium]